MVLRRLVPPIVLDLLRGQANNRQANERQAEFNSYEQAAHACQGESYEEGTLLEVIRRKTEIYREQLRSVIPRKITAGELPLLSVIGLQTGADHLRVIDFGGACGAHYFMVKSVLGQRSPRFAWHVVETAGMVNAARGLENDELKFFSSLDEARMGLGPLDLVFSSGAVQCVPDPYETLQGLIDCGAKSLVLARLGMTTGESDVIFVHESQLSTNGPGPLPDGFQDAACQYPFTFPVRAKIDTLIQTDYRLSIELPDSGGVFSVNDHPLVGVGYIAERRNEADRKNENNGRSAHAQ